MKFNWMLTMVAAGSVFVLGCDSGTASSGGGSLIDAVGDTSDTTGDTSIPGSVTIQQLPDAAVSATCAYMNRCGLGNGYTFVSLDTCANLYKSEDMDSSMADLQKAVAEGKVKYDGAQAAACLKAIADRPCDAEAMKEPLACKLAFVGTTANGGPCDQDEYCVSGFCERPQGNSACAGKCAALKKAGDGCNDDGDCEGSMMCTAGKCGEQPLPAPTGQPCQTNPCADGLYCNWDTNPAVCAEPGGEGQPCASLKECQAGLSCQGSSGDYACAKLAANGQPCEDPSMGTLGQGGCEAGLVCGVVMGAKGPAPQCQSTVKLGQACVSDFQCGGLDAGCLSGKCAILPGMNQTCTPVDPMKGKFFTCLPSLACDPVSLKCVPPPAAGKPCINNDCASGNDCVDGTCTPLPTQGQPCEYQCAEPFECDQGTCVAPVCEF
jgi:hypothetical protein